MKGFLRGKMTHQTQDALGKIQVLDDGRHRILRFDSIFEQSKVDRNKPFLPVHEYNRAMVLPVAFNEPRHATILGLGGGVLAGALHHLLPDCQLHAVELRREVWIVARRFFDLPDASTIKITIADARRILPELPEGGTDLILTDLYGAQRMSPAQSQRGFVDQCAEALGPDGWLVINYHRLPPHNSPVFLHLRIRFAVVLLFKCKAGNYVLFASKQPFEPMHSCDHRLTALEERLPIGWRKLMRRTIRLA